MDMHCTENTFLDKQTLICLSLPYGQVGKPPKLHLLPLYPPPQVQKKAALTVPSGQQKKTSIL